jgi:hypothetical protein
MNMGGDRAKQHKTQSTNKSTGTGIVLLAYVTSLNGRTSSEIRAANAGKAAKVSREPILLGDIDCIKDANYASWTMARE